MVLLRLIHTILQGISPESLEILTLAIFRIQRYTCIQRKGKAYRKSRNMEENKYDLEAGNHNGEPLERRMC